MTTHTKLFGTDGIRGRANVFPISPDYFLTLGQAIGAYFKKHHHHPRILIGKDTRRSGYMLEQALSAGICSVGVDSFFLGPLPSPGIAYLTRGMRATAGIVISASHNPYYDNGIKIFSADGYKLPDQAEDELEALINNNQLPAFIAGSADIGSTQRIDDAIGQYAVFLKEQFPKHLTLEGLHLVLDCANGASYRVAPKVFAELGAKVTLISAAPNGYNINENCGALHPEQLQAAVKELHADLGFAFDGDADRLVVVDGSGEILDGDMLLGICAIYYLQEKRLAKNTVVTTVMSNLGLELAIKKHGGSLLRTAVGDRYVVEAMRKGGYNLGGEQSGHLVFRDCSTTGDGILAALSVLEIILSRGLGLSALKRDIQKCPQVLHNINVARKEPLERLPLFTARIRQMEHALGDSGRILFRYSGTENKARIMIEGQEQKVVEAMAAELVALFSSSLAKLH
jgi:phosphoglucosamine mutase